MCYFSKYLTAHVLLHYKRLATCLVTFISSLFLYVNCLAYMQNGDGGYATYELTRSYGWLEVLYEYLHGVYVTQTLYLTLITHVKWILCSGYEQSDNSFWAKTCKIYKILPSPRLWDIHAGKLDTSNWILVTWRRFMNILHSDVM